MEILNGQRYRHYKNGKTYIVLAIGRNSETLEKQVVYQAEYEDIEFGDKAVWIRPYDMFVEQVEFEGKTVSRFTLLSD